MTDENRRWWVLVGMGLTLGMVLLDETVVGVALDTIQADLDMSDVAGHWIVNAYMLSLAAFVAVGGRLADLYGYRRVFLVGAVLFGAASVACALAESGAWLVVARGVQGLGAAVIFPLSLAFVTMSFPPEKRGLAIGIYGMLGTTGLTIGPLVGGVFTEYLSWRWIFGINPIVVIAVILVVVFVWQEPPREASGERLDVAGLTTLAITLSTAVLAIMQGSTWGWTSPSIIGLFTVAVVVGAIFWRIEARAPDPLIDVHLFGSASFTGSNAGVFVGQFSKSTVIVFLPLFLQQVLDLTAVEAGLALMPGMIVSVVVSMPVGRLVDRFGAGLPLVLGLGGLAVAHVALAGLIGLDDVAVLILPLVVWGVAVVFTFEGSLTAIMNGVSDDEQGQASGISNESQMLGGALGIAVLSALQTGGASWTVVFATSAAVVVAVLVLAAVTVDRSRP